MCSAYHLKVTKLKQAGKISYILLLNGNCVGFLQQSRQQPGWKYMFWKLSVVITSSSSLLSQVHNQDVLNTEESQWPLTLVMLFSVFRSGSCWSTSLDKENGSVCTWRPQVHLLPPLASLCPSVGGKGSTFAQPLWTFENPLDKDAEGTRIVFCTF